ncbi:hypothetical protein FD754_009247 [Muntiacus muntjak]|uniref:Uncharacterized protein n=1 Tax=Muntiacus muntjak TaxID=9888 RepID=A0A5N3WTW5_MUNMU|nr:hypothetical protein FD754_009247 [Muntiacus muntjak]
MAENPLFFLKNTSDTWLKSSSPFWAIDTILAFLCGLGLFLLILPYLENNPSFPPPKKHGTIRKRGRSRSRIRHGALKAGRDCLEALEEVWDLTSLLLLRRLPDKDGFHQVSSQDAPGDVCKAGPAGAHQPSREEATPTMPPPPLIQWPLSQDSTHSPHSVSSLDSVHSLSSESTSRRSEPLFLLDSLSPWPLALSASPPGHSNGEACPPPPRASSDSPPLGSALSLNQGACMSLPLGTTPHSLSPQSPWRPAMSGLVRSSRPLSAVLVAWGCQSWSLSTVTNFESQRKHLPCHPPEASFWGYPKNGQIEASTISFVNPDVQKLLEILITKRVELNSWKEKKEEEEAGYLPNSLGEKDQLLSQYLGPLYSYALLFNELSKAEKLQIQSKVTSQLSLAQPSTHSVAQMQPQPFTPTMCQGQARLWAQLETTTHLIHSFPVEPSSSEPQTRYHDVSDPIVQNKAQSFIPKTIHILEHHFLKKQVESGRTLPSLVKKSQQVFSQVIPNLPQESRSSQAHSSKKLEHHISKRFMEQDSSLPCRIQASQKLMQEGPSSPSAGRGKRSQDAQEMRSKCPARILPGTDLCPHVGQSMGGAHKVLYMTSANHPMKVPVAKPQSERELSPGRKHPEKVLGALISKKAQQICEGQIPVNVHCSRLAANHFLGLPGESNAPTGTENTGSSQDEEASMNTYHKSLVVSPYIQQELEASVLKIQVRHRWVLLLKVFKFIFRVKKCFLHTPSKIHLEGPQKTSSAPSRKESSKNGGSSPPGEAPHCSGRTPTWKYAETLKGTSDWTGSQSTNQIEIINIDMKKSQFLRSNTNPSLNTKFVDSNPEDVDVDEQFCKLEFQGFTDWLALSQPTCVRLQVYVFTAANTLASQESLSCFETLSSRESSNSQILDDVTSSGGGSQGQQVALRGKPRHKSQRRNFVSTDAREANRRPKLGQQRKGLVVQRFYQARRMSHPGQKKQSAESLQSKFHLKKRQVSSENHFRERIKHFLQWVCPSKGKRPEEPLQKYSKAVETQALMTAVGQILEEKMVLHCGPHASELNWYKVELQAPLGPPYCYHRFLSYQEQRRVIRQTAHQQQATPTGHRCPAQSKWTRPRDSNVALPTRGARSPSRQSLPAWIKNDKRPRPSPPLSKALSSSEMCLFSIRTCLSQLSNRKSLFQEKNVYHADKNMFFSY